MDDARKEVTDVGVYVKFALADEPAALLVWTTTPWNLPGSVALAVQAEAQYCRVRCSDTGEQLLLAHNCVPLVAKLHPERTLEVLETVTGQSLVGRRYVPPYTSMPPHVLSNNINNDKRKR